MQKLTFRSHLWSTRHDDIAAYKLLLSAKLRSPIFKIFHIFVPQVFFLFQFIAELYEPVAVRNLEILKNTR